MTFSVVPFALQNATLSADALRQAASSHVSPGGGIVSAGDLTVTQTGTPSMNVSVGVGRIWIPGTNVGNVAGGNFSSQAMYYGQNDQSFTVAVTTAHSINPRIDVVYAAIEDSQYAGTTNTGKLAVVAGVPTSGATYPANAPAIPSNAKAVAWINVPANAPSITNANITNLASFPASPASFARGLQHEGVVSGSSGGFTGLTVINNIASFTFKAGRRYEIVWDGHHQSSIAGDIVDMQIATCATADAASAITGLTVRRKKFFGCPSANVLAPNFTKAPLTFAADTTLQVKFLAQRNTGTGTVSISATTEATILYQINDVGAQF